MIREVIANVWRAMSISRQGGRICQPEYQGGEQHDGENAKAGQKPDLLLMRRKAPFIEAAVHGFLKMHNRPVCSPTIKKIRCFSRCFFQTQSSLTGEAGCCMLKSDFKDDVSS
jgi:hypothetical protein